MKLSAIFYCLGLLFGLVGLADAACTQADIQGVWEDFALAHSANAVGHCTFVIRKDGSVAPSSKCLNYTSTTNMAPIYATSGKFTVGAACRVTAKLAGNNGVNAFFEGQLERNKLSFAGISRNNTGGIALHHFVKK